MAVIATDCPFCMTMNVAFQYEKDHLFEATRYQEKPAITQYETVGKCGRCTSLAILYFDHDVNFIGTLPKIPEPECPQYLPPNVERAYLEAETALLARLFPSAASQYRKAIDRAVTPFVDDKSKTGMLGNKIGSLEKTGFIPAPMIEWIRLVKDDANYALHDDDRDFESADEIEPMRTFAHTLLTYLYTMPKRVELAREVIDSRKSE